MVSKKKNFISYLPEVLAAQEAAAEAAVLAAADVVVDEARRIARQGFKSGAFVTDGAESIYAELTGRGNNAQAIVGSTEEHFRFWEVGHHNIFTGQFEQNRWLTTAMTSTRPRQQMAAALAATAAAEGTELKGRLLGGLVRRQMSKRIGGAY